MTGFGRSPKSRCQKKKGKKAESDPIHPRDGDNVDDKKAYEIFRKLLREYGETGLHDAVKEYDTLETLLRHRPLKGSK
jgi:hypothetical protein